MTTPSKGFLLLAWMTAFIGTRIEAQSPLGPEVRVNQSSEDAFYPDVSVDPDGVFTIGWFYHFGFLENPEYLAARSFDSSGHESSGENRALSFLGDDWSIAQRVVSIPNGFTLFYTKVLANRYTYLLGSRFTKDAVPLRSQFLVSSPSSQSSNVADAVALPSGGYFVLAEDGPCFDCFPAPLRHHHLFARVLDPTGLHSSPYFRVDLDDHREAFTGANGLAVDQAGHVVAVWDAQTVDEPFDPEQSAILSQRFLVTGQREGAPFLVNSRTPGLHLLPAVAADAAGDFVIVWQFQRREQAPKSILGKRFTSAGAPRGKEFLVVAGLAADTLRPSVASDAQGNFVVVWSGDAPYTCGVKGRLYRSDGRPAGPSFSLASSTADQCDDLPQVAFGPQGVLAATWERDGSGGIGIYAARFLASPGDEPCLARGGQVLCFTPTSGGEPVLTQSFGGRPGEITLIGDFDGDGRADLCTRFGTTYACDLQHYGVLSDGTAAAFGLPTDIPLLGDVDGDGKADLCVFRSGQFLCDTTRQGGNPNVTIHFGLPADVPLLADVDGDGKADPCVYRAGVFLCDTTHRGKAPNVSIPFGQPGDPPALGDMDGDGKADPCVLHAGHLLCDTTHRGGKPNVDIDLHAGPGDRLILGNLDGL